MLTVDKISIRLENINTGEVNQEIRISDIAEIYKTSKQVRMSPGPTKSATQFLLVIESDEGKKIILDRLIYKTKDLRWLQRFILENNPKVKSSFD